MKRIRNQFLSVFLAATLCLGLLGCQAQEPGSAQKPASPAPEVQEPQGTPATETENLVKLCKVWGYTKYMHPAFLLGKKDWDEELLTLIPQVREMTTAEEVNTLLHDWFVSLGEIDYGRRPPVPNWSRLEEDKKVFVADTAWTKDAGYLGEELAANFAQLPEELPNINWKNAPVTFGNNQLPVFDNEPEHTGDYGNPSFRLLGLFRLWNVFEYYYPYLHLMNRDWGELLEEGIPEMLAVNDQAGYEKTLWNLARETRDAHVYLYGGLPRQKKYQLPVICIEAEDHVVVQHTMEDCSLKAGDVLLRIDGKAMGEIMAEEFGDHPRPELVINYLFSHGVKCYSTQAEVQIIRDGEEMTLFCEAVSSSTYMEHPTQYGPYELLKDNIGYIDISRVDTPDIREAAEQFRDTQGLVVDLREFPNLKGDVRALDAYILGWNVTALLAAVPSIALPGAYAKVHTIQCGWAEGFSEHYEGPVVVLINENAYSESNCHAAAYSMAENTILLGRNTDGSNGSTIDLTLPGGVKVHFTAAGIYHPDGTQTQRTGIAPDIRVEPTIQGIAEGRDEVLEAAVQYILEKGEK